MRRIEDWGDLASADLHRLIALFATVSTGVSAIAHACDLLKTRGEMRRGRMERILELASAG